MISIPIKYLDFVWALDAIYRYYPHYHASELLVMADDILKWMNNDLPEDSSTLVYLKSSFSSPGDAIKAVWNEINLLAGPFLFRN
jgi:hypothetical protein